MPIVIEISAILKLGKFKIFTSIKSTTNPLAILSIKLLIPPANTKIKETIIEQLICAVFFY